VQDALYEAYCTALSGSKGAAALKGRLTAQAAGQLLGSFLEGSLDVNDIRAVLGQLRPALLLSDDGSVGLGEMVLAMQAVDLKAGRRVLPGEFQTLEEPPGAR
jgi:hypothetical protein